MPVRYQTVMDCKEIFSNEKMRKLTRMSSVFDRKSKGLRPLRRLPQGFSTVCIPAK